MYDSFNEKEGYPRTEEARTLQFANNSVTFCYLNDSLSVHTRLFKSVTVLYFH